MIRVLVYDSTERALRQGGAELIEAWDGAPSSTIWVNLEDESAKDEDELLSRRFGIHRLAIADALRERHPPKIERFKDNTFILLKELDAVSTSLDFGTVQLSLFLHERFLVTRSSARSLSTETVWAKLVAGEIPPDTSPAVLALRLCRAVADRLMPLLMSVETRLEEMEAEMLERPSDDLLDGYLSLSAHRLNQIMQTLTIVTVIFVPITFMPELAHPAAYFMLLGAMLVVVSSILAFFYHRGWLGGRVRRKRP